MPPVHLTLGPSLANALIATAVFLYLWRRDRERYLALWAASWLLWAVRYTYGLATDYHALVPGTVFLPVLALARGALMLWGTHVLLGRPLPRLWIGILAADGLLIVAEAISATSLPASWRPGLIHYLIFAATLMWAGWLHAVAITPPLAEARLTGVALIILGALQTTFPYIEVSPAWWRENAYLVLNVIQGVIPVGVLMLHVRRSADEVQRLNEARAASLTRALAEFIPICAHCKSVRDGEDWMPIERYVSGRTQSRFSHGICPTCVSQHFGQFLDRQSDAP